MANFSDNERGQASAKVWLARIYVQDLEEFATGDVNRFSRMVDGKGVAIASPARWLEHIAGIADNPVVRCFYADKMQALIERVTKAGYRLPTLFD